MRLPNLSFIAEAREKEAQDDIRARPLEEIRAKGRREAEKRAAREGKRHAGNYHISANDVTQNMTLQVISYASYRGKGSQSSNLRNVHMQSTTFQMHHANVITR